MLCFIVLYHQFLWDPCDRFVPIRHGFFTGNGEIICEERLADMDEIGRELTTTKRDRVRTVYIIPWVI